MEHGVPVGLGVGEQQCVMHVCVCVHICPWTWASVCTGSQLEWPEHMQARWALPEVELCLCLCLSLLGTRGGPCQGRVGAQPGSGSWATKADTQLHDPIRTDKEAMVMMARLSPDPFLGNPGLILRGALGKPEWEGSGHTSWANFLFSFPNARLFRSPRWLLLSSSCAMKTVVLRLQNKVIEGDHQARLGSADPDWVP